MRHETHLFKRSMMKIRLAETPDEVRMAQRLRHDVFVEECGAIKPKVDGIDADKYDEVCAHLLVIEPDVAGTSPYPLKDGGLVGTSRLIGQGAAERAGGFYSASEFELAPLLARQAHLKFLELGRTCILKHARGTAVMELLWQGIWNYVRAGAYDVMIGCASFEGTVPEAHAAALNLMAQHCRAPEEWHAKALPESGHPIPTACDPALDPKRILVGMPPLIKGYMRLGCYIGEGCVVDHAFNTVDVLIVLPVKSINPRYFARFGQPT